MNSAGAAASDGAEHPALGALPAALLWSRLRPRVPRGVAVLVLFPVTLVYLAVVYLRPTDLIADWSNVPVVMIMSAASAPFLAGALLESPRRLVALPQDRFFLAYWCAIAVSNVVAGWFGGALRGFTTFAQVVFQYFLIRAAIRRPSQLRGAMWLLVGIMAFHAVSGIRQHVTGFGFGGVEPIVTSGVPRIRSIGIFNDPNDLALFLLIGVPFLMAAILGRGVAGRTRALAIGATVLLLLAVYYTNSRGGILDLAVALTVFGWRRFGRATGTTAVAVVMIALLAAGPSRMQETDTEEASTQGRIQAWSSGLLMLRSHPLTGVGYSQFTEYHPLVAHNSFVHAFAELGLFGGTCFIGMAFWYFESLRRTTPGRRSGPQWLDDWRTPFVAAGAGLIVGMWFLSRQYNPVPFTLLALGACYVQLSPGDRAEPITASGRDHWLVFGLTVSAVIAVWITVRLFASWGN